MKFIIGEIDKSRCVSYFSTVPYLAEIYGRKWSSAYQYCFAGNSINKSGFFINSKASKNDEDIAVKALKKYGISEYFVCPQINWNAKSQNIKNIADILDLGMDTFT